MEKILQILKKNFNDRITLAPKREGVFQVIIPIIYEDGDMVDVFITQSPKDKNKVRIFDWGLTLMRLSYDFEIGSSAREKILENILIHNNVLNENGNLYIDTNVEYVYENLMQFIGCQQKVTSMSYWKKEVIKSLFFENLDEFIMSDLKEFKPTKNISPISDATVDYKFDFAKKPFYLFGVNNDDRAKEATINLYALQKASLENNLKPFISIVVYEDFESISKKNRTRLVNNSDKPFTSFNEFKNNGDKNIRRLAA